MCHPLQLESSKLISNENCQKLSCNIFTTILGKKKAVVNLMLLMASPPEVSKPHI